MKRVWFDLETTGVDPNNDRITQMAFLVEENFKVIAEFIQNVYPGELPNDYDISAGKITGLTSNSINQSHDDYLIDNRFDSDTFIDSNHAFKLVTDFLDKYVGSKKSGSINKAWLCGKNVVGFDLPFLKVFFDMNMTDGQANWLHYFEPMQIDIDSFVAMYMSEKLYEVEKREKPKNLKLITLCNMFDVKLDNAHNALSDTRATFQLFSKIYVSLGIKDETGGKKSNRSKQLELI